MIDYKGALKAGGNNLSDDDRQIMKSLFTNDILLLIKQIHPEILKGKQIATLLGASSISKNARLAAQRLQLPYRLAMQQISKTGTLSKDRMSKLQSCWTEFTQSLVDEVFEGKTLMGANTSNASEEEEES